MTMKSDKLRRPIRRRCSIAVLVLSLLLLLVAVAGCGGDEETAAPAAPPAAEPAPPAEEPVPPSEEPPAEEPPAEEPPAEEPAPAENELGYVETELRLLGLIDPADVTPGLHICFFGDGTTNTYVLANNAGAAQAAEKLGVEIDIFLGDWDPARQLNQLETAISQNQCDGIVLESIDPNVVCKAATEAATAAEIPVAIGNVPICADANWTEGTITFSGSQTLDYYLAYTDWVFGEFMKANPEGGKMAAITGPANWSGTIPPYGSTVSYEQMLEKYPDIELVQVIDSDFTVEGGLNAANTIIQTHPDVQGLIVQYDQDAHGAIQALKGAGKQPGELMVFGLGYDHSGETNIKEGWQNGSMLLEPVEEIGHATEALIAFLSGVPQCEDDPDGEVIATLVPGEVECIPKFLWTLLDPTLAAAFGPEASPFITAANADVITPEW